MTGKSDTGLPVPDTSPLGRVRLNTARCTRVWRTLARELGQATDALERAQQLASARAQVNASNVIALPAVAGASVEEAVRRYHDIALRILCTPTDRVEDLRQRLALAALLMGRRNPLGALGRSAFDDLGDLALALLDMELCRIAHGWGQAPKRRRASRRPASRRDESQAADRIAKDREKSLIQPGRGR
jgi:hypothetical protein